MNVKFFHFWFLILVLLSVVCFYAWSKATYSANKVRLSVISDKINESSLDDFQELFGSAGCSECLAKIKEAGLKGHLNSALFYHVFINEGYCPESFSLSVCEVAHESEPDYLLSVDREYMAPIDEFALIDKILQLVEKGTIPATHKTDILIPRSERLKELILQASEQNQIKALFNLLSNDFVNLHFKSRFFYTDGV